MWNLILNFLKIVLFGIVEGITEWLPVSSTGHMIILEKFLSISSFTNANFYDLFEVVIQLGAIMAVIVTFFKKLWPFGYDKTKEEKKEIWRTWLNIIIACVPAAVVGLFLDDWLNSIFYNFLSVSIVLIIYGVVFIVMEYLFKKTNKSFKTDEVNKLNWKMAAIIGLAQMLALIPGTSRSGITIIAAMMIGCTRTVSAEFSFYLSIPIMIGASLYKGAKFIVKGYEMPADGPYYLIVGCLVAFLVSLVTIKYFLKLIKTKSFTGFGIYRVALGTVLLILFFTTSLNGDTSYTATLVSSLSQMLPSKLNIILNNA